jgi:lysophospholipase L1-like esterase
LPLFEAMHSVIDRIFRATFPNLQTFGSMAALGRFLGGKGKRTRLMVFGDSNAYRPGNGRNCWPAMLQRKSGNRLQVINESVDGRTTQYDKGECNGLGVIEYKLSHVQPLAYVLVALGTNDIKDQYGLPDEVGVVEGVEKIVNIVTSVDDRIRPVLLTPPPLGNVTKDELAGAEDRLRSVVSGYRRLAASRKIALLDLFSILETDRDLENDGVHLNTRGRKTVANTVWDYLLHAHHCHGAPRAGEAT